MSKQFLSLGVFVALVIALPASGQPPVKPVDPTLAAVPTDAFGFVSVRVSSLWDNPAAKPLRDWLAAQKMSPLDSIVGLPPADIDRVTIFKASWNPVEGGPPLVLITTRKPYNEAVILKALGVDKPLFQPWRKTAVRAFEVKEHFSWVVRMDERTLLYLPRTSGDHSLSPDLLAQLIARKTDGPLAGALAEAAHHDITVGADVRGVEEFAALIQADRNKKIIPLLALLKARTVTLTADFDKTAKGRFTLTFADAETAKRAAPVLEEAIRFLQTTWSETPGFRADEFGKIVAEWVLGALKSTKVSTDGASVIASVDVPFADDFSKFVAALPKQYGVFHNDASATNNLKQLAIALHSYHDANRTLPGDVMSVGNQLLPWSWRVQILPFIEQDNLYKQLNVQLAWDDPANLKTLQAAEMPKVFEVPGRPAPKGHTYFRIFSLPKSAKGTDRPFFQEGERGPQLTDVTDGLSNTFMIVEAEEAVPWYKPDLLGYDGKLPLPKLGAKGADRFLAVMGDGSVKTLKPGQLGEKTLRALITINGGEVVELPK